MTEILNENLLKSDFTFGFELEACAQEAKWNDYSNEPDEETDLDSSSNGVDGELAREIDRALNNLLNKNVPEKQQKYGNIDNDPSVSSNDDYDYTFEWASPVLDCTPYNFNRVIKMLYNLDSIGVYTNDSCGFHHHLSYKGITERDMIWIYVNLCMDTDFRNYMKYVDGIKLTSDEWSPDDALNDIKNAIENNNYEQVLFRLSDDKYRLFRIHPYGTLEWRGPRDFLNDGELEVIKDFYSKFNTYISKIIEYQASKTIFGTNITRDEFFKNLTIAKEKNPDNNRELEFLVRTHGYHDRPLDYKTERGATISNKLLTALTKNPELFYNLVMEDRKSLITLLRKEKHRVENIVSELYYEGVSNPSEFTKKLFTLSSSAFTDFSDSFQILGQFTEYLNKNICVTIFNDCLNNNNYNGAASIMRAIIEENLNLPYKIFFNSMVTLLHNNMNRPINERWLDITIRYCKKNNYDINQIAKIILLFVKYGFRLNVRPYFDSEAVVEVIKTIDNTEITAWNNRLIAGLFEKPFNKWMAELIINNNSLDMKALIALCSRNGGIFNYLDSDIRQQLNMNID